MFKSMFAILAAFLCLAGCSTPSIHPIWSRETLIDEAGLVGDWKGESKDDFPVYHISKGADAYRLIVKAESDKKPADWEFEVYLVKLGDHRFADLAANKKARDDQRDNWGTFFVPSHLFVRYTLEGDTLTVWIPNRNWIRRAIEDKRIKLASTPMEEEVTLITSETAELQAFLKEHATDAGAFDKTVLKRQKAAP